MNLFMPYFGLLVCHYYQIIYTVGGSTETRLIISGIPVWPIHTRS